MTDDVLFNEYDVPYDYCPAYESDNPPKPSQIKQLEAQIRDLRRENEQMRSEILKMSQTMRENEK